MTEAAAALPSLAVVIPTRDRADMLRRAVESVRNQSRADWEMVIVDDSSADRTAEVALALAADDPRIRMMRHAMPKGAPAARNEGLLMSNAPFVAFLDDDVTWDPAFAESMLAALQRSEAGVAYCDSAYGAAGGDRLHLKGDVSGNSWELLIRRNVVGGTPCVVIRRSVLEAVGGFDERLPRLQDWDLWLRLARVTRFVYVAEPLVRLHPTEGGISTRGDALAEAIRIVRLKYEPLLSDRRNRGAFLHTLGHLGVIGGASQLGARLLREAARQWPLPPWRAPMALLASVAGGAYRAVSGVHARSRERPHAPQRAE